MQRRDFLKTTAAGVAAGAVVPGQTRPANSSANSANAVRSVARLFTSDVEDKPWFNDREMWPAYFDMLAKAGFNRFHLALGIGYDFLREVTDAYFVFAYPFFLSPAGYRVRATNLADAERDRNLEMLKFITSQAAAHGLEFQLGLWTHGYQWINSPQANQVIEGLTAENHAEYCRDALAELLRACPKITGVTFRIHGESGVAEGNYPFWKTVFDGVVRSGRRIEIDMHAKGIDQGMIDVALGTGMPVKVSPKFWAEHMGLPYHQADIREQERPKADRSDKGFFALSSGSRSFTRYGYADLLREDRKYGIVHRIWPGTQRLLLWGDPMMATAYARAFQFCGSNGVDIMEPLSFKGRRGSGRAGGRCGYADKSLEPRWDWQKYATWYRVWGTALSGREPLAPKDAESALASASRILPLITTAHGPSAANNNYWPEMYTNQSILNIQRKHPYSDMSSPKLFGNVGGFDPQLFLSANECADDLVKGQHRGKYSPLDVADGSTGFLRRRRGDGPRQAGLGKARRQKLAAWKSMWRFKRGSEGFSRRRCAARCCTRFTRKHAIGRRWRKRLSPIEKRARRGRISRRSPRTRTSRTSPSASFRGCADIGWIGCRRSTTISRIWPRSSSLRPRVMARPRAQSHRYPPGASARRLRAGTRHSRSSSQGSR